MNPEIQAFAEHMRQQGASAQEIDTYIRGAIERQKPVESPRGASLAPIAQGATLGFADEALGAIEGANQFLHGGSFKKGYSEGVEKTRNVGREFAQEHPAANVALTMAGGAIPAMATGGAGVPGLARSIGTGAGYGAVSGAGSAEGGLANRAKGATFGGLLGSFVGAAVPAVASTLGKSAKVAGSFINRGGKPATERANAVIAQALERDNVPLSTLSAANQTRTPRMLLDMAGENLHGVARAAQAIPSRAKDEIPAALMARHAGLGTRLGKDLEDALGVQGKDVNQKAETLLAARRENAAPLYAEAYKAPPIQDERINEILSLPDFKKAYAHAKTIAQLEGVTLPETLELSPAAKAVLESGSEEAKAAIRSAQGQQGIPVQVLDYVKRAVDDMIKSGQHAPLEAGGLGATRSRALLQRQHELLDLIDQHVPAFAQARSQYSGDLAMEKALDAGRNFLKEDPATNRQTLSGLNKGERQTFLLGAIDNVKKEMEKAADGADLTKRIFGTKTKRDNINALFDNPRAASQFREWVNNEARLVRNKNAIMGNSNTAAKLSEIADMTGGGIGDVAGSLVTGNPGRAVRDVFRMAATNRLQGVSRNVADELAGKLTAQPGTQNFVDLLKELGSASAKQRQTITNQNLFARALAGTAGQATGK